MKILQGVYGNPNVHWVGDGFPVRSLFSYDRYGAQISPFLLLDYAGPANFRGDGIKRGVGSHPHRGFETVTIVYKGEVSHRDSTGDGGTIGPGDVQWMTAGSGILHEEFHSEEFSKKGGELEMFQLWVNLPSSSKMTKPRYQSILNYEIPSVSLPNGVGVARILAGKYLEKTGPAKTFSPLNVWDLTLEPGKQAVIPIQEGWNSILVVRKGKIKINQSTTTIVDSQFGVFDRTGENIEIEVLENSSVLLLSGEPISEPIVGYGPFVMNTEDEIITAINDFRSGKFGNI